MGIGGLRWLLVRVFIMRRGEPGVIIGRRVVAIVGTRTVLIVPTSSSTVRGVIIIVIVVAVPVKRFPVVVVVIWARSVRATL